LGVREARLHAGFGLAIGDDKVISSVDGGASWADAPAPRRAREAIAHAGNALEESGVFAISEVGAKVDAALRVGWGPGDQRDEPVPSPAVPLPRRGEPPRANDQALACTAAAGAESGTPPLAGLNQAKTLLGSKAPAPKGTKREASAAPTGRFGMLDAIAVFEE